jgi:hypothetical protein
MLEGVGAMNGAAAEFSCNCISADFQRFNNREKDHDVG